MAILKRAAIVVNSKNFLYVRPASEAEVRVERHRYVDGKTDFIKEGSKANFAAWKNGNEDPPVDFDAAVLWEQNWLKEVMRKSVGGTSTAPAPPPAPRAKPSSLIGGSGSASSSSGQPRAEVAIKQEPGVFRNLLSGVHHVIDIEDSAEEDSPPPPKSRRLDAPQQPSGPPEIDSTAGQEEDNTYHEIANPANEEEENVFEHPVGLDD